MSEQDARALRERYTAAIPEVPVDPAPIVQRGRRRRRLNRLGGAAATVALAAVAVGAIAVGAPVLRADPDVPPATSPPPAETPPPPAETPSDFSLWLSAERVPPGDVELIAVLVNHTGADATFGLRADVERWNGRAWELHRRMIVCLDHSLCTARMYPPGDAGYLREVDDIGLGASVEHPGRIERFSTGGLEPGWYRVSQDGDLAARGVFQVVEGALAPAPLWPTDAPAISIRPALVPAGGGRVELPSLVPSNPDGTRSDEDVADAVRGLAPVAGVERWTGSGWDRVAEVDLEFLTGEEYNEPFADVPALSPGAYRLVRSGPAGDHTGNFWVLRAGDLVGSSEPVPPGSDAQPVVIVDQYRSPPEVPPGAVPVDGGGVYTADRSIAVVTKGSTGCPVLPSAITVEDDRLVVVYVVRVGEGDPGWSCRTDLVHTTYVLELPDDADPLAVEAIEVRSW